MQPKSFYDLRFSVSPGAARKNAHYICGDLDEVIGALDSELEESGNLWLLFAYGRGADLFLDVYQRGERVRSIDLHPFITIQVDGYPAITFRGSGQPTGYAVGAEDPAMVKTKLADGMFQGDFDGRIEITVDWDSIPVPPLVGEIADFGDYVMLGEGPLGDLEDLAGLDEDGLEDELIDRGWVAYGDHDFV
jgi:hypothetical protein